MRGQHAAVGGVVSLLLRLQHDSAGAVTEQDAGSTVVPIEDSRKCFGADHQRALVTARTQKIIGGSEREDEAGTYCLQVEGRAMRDAESVLYRNRRGGKGVVG